MVVWRVGEKVVQRLDAVLRENLVRPVGSCCVGEVALPQDGRRDVGGLARGGRDGVGLAGVASCMHGGIALDNALQAQPGVEGPPQALVGSPDVEVVVLEGMDDLVHEGVPVVRAKLSHPYAVIFGDDIGDVLSR